MIEITADKFIDGIVTFHISRQDVEDYKRLKNREMTFEIKGINYSISTGYSPAFYFASRRLFVRGKNKKSNFDRIEVGFSEYLNICELVKKYNENFF